MKEAIQIMEKMNTITISESSDSMSSRYVNTIKKEDIRTIVPLISMIW